MNAPFTSEVKMIKGYERCMWGGGKEGEGGRVIY